MGTIKLTKVEITNLDIVNAVNTLADISRVRHVVDGNMVEEIRSFDHLAKSLVAKDLRVITEHSQDYDKARKESELEFRKKDKDGNLIYADTADKDGKVNGKERVWIKHGEDKFVEKVNELLNMKMEVNIHMIPYALLESADITPEELSRIVWMIDFEE